MEYMGCTGVLRKMGLPGSGLGILHLGLVTLNPIPQRTYLFKDLYE